MQSKKLLVTLIVSLILLFWVFSCGSKAAEPETLLKEAVATETLPEEFVSSDDRFSAEYCNIPNLNMDRFKSYSFIITDHQTGKQFLYIFTYDSVKSLSGGPAIVEIGSIGDAK